MTLSRSSRAMNDSLDIEKRDNTLGICVLTELGPSLGSPTCCSSKDSLHIFLNIVVPKTAPILQVRPPQSRAEQDNPLPRPVGGALPDAPQDMAGPPGCQGTADSYSTLMCFTDEELDWCFDQLRDEESWCGRPAVTPRTSHSKPVITLMSPLLIGDHSEQD
ncbi:hypothetical protein WISP_72901 [Willisornis vidua]|uniref:Uncharacterized protein n=1 Tax=Willisornis vidua TaxID=1566151 RepID=A0ABQ9DCK5_9PASS|nr:hypothetical protein WISP_72901 [Willisornis vidua]